MLMTLMFAASLMVFTTGVFAQSATPTGETEITGTLERINSGTIVVAGQTISIVGAEINDVLVVGRSVKAHVSTVNGVLTAREVETVSTPDDDNSNSNTNDNTDDNSNANDNTDDNSNSNANDNTDDNSNDNTNTGAAAVTLQQAIDIVLAVYPTTDILSVELTTKFGGTPVWEVKIRNGIELNIDAQSALILTIDRRGDDDNSSGNANSNDNRDDDGGNSNGNVNSNDNRDDDNGNMNSNSNDNSDDHGGNDNNDDHGGNSGSGGGDDHGSNDDDD